MSCDGRKWECLYCTYLNWQSALKCTMCRSPKPLEVIEEGVLPVISSPLSLEAVLNSDSTSQQNSYYGDISLAKQLEISPTNITDFEIAVREKDVEVVTKANLSSIATKKPNSPVQNVISNILQEATFGAPSSTNENWTSITEKRSARLQTWTCGNCCGQNWINASSCKQCNMSKSAYCGLKSFDFQVKPYSHNKQGESLKISELVDSGNYKETTKRPNTTPTASPTKINNCPQGAEKFSISRSNSPNNSNANATSQEKWTCSVCTYDNWPRSAKCIMCMCPYSFDQAVGHVANEVNNASVYSQTNKCVDSVMTPALANLSLGVSNNRGPSFETSNYEENAVNTNYTDVIRRRMFRGSEMDGKWLDACCGAVDGNIQAVEEYLTSGGDATRQLTEAEVLILNRPSAFDIGFTLIHLALRFHQEDVLATLLSQVDGEPPVAKRVPSYAAPNVAIEIRRHAMGSIRPRKGNLRCHFTSELVTFTLPSEIDDMPPETQETVFDEILDRDVQKELENGQIINWSLEVSDQLNSRLYALWNRSAGDCLLDSILQATWGIFDRDNSLRRALSDSLHDCATQFYQRWKESELLHARHLNFSLNEAQCSTDWAKLLSLASQPGSSLEQLHIFALAHILRRPIIVYGVKYVKSFRGEAIGFARFEGVYLPFLWEPSFCWRWPVSLAYTRGHFSALVPMEPDCDPLARVDSAAQLGAEDINERSAYLPLTTVEGALLPIQFLTQSEIGKEEFILSQWLDIAFTESGIMVARQRIQKRPLLVSQMVEEWLTHYRRLGQITSTPYMRQSTATCYSSEGESDND